MHNSIEDMTFIENTPFTFSKPEYEIAASDFLKMDRYGLQSYFPRVL